MKLDAEVRKSKSRLVCGGQQCASKLACGSISASNLIRVGKWVGCFSAHCSYVIEKIGRGERIRTSGLLVPNQALYQAEPRPDSLTF
jgi:hypothetical protein